MTSVKGIELTFLFVILKKVKTVSSCESTSHFTFLSDKKRQRHEMVTKLASNADVPVTGSKPSNRTGTL